MSGKKTNRVVTSILLGGIIIELAYLIITIFVPMWTKYNPGSMTVINSWVAQELQEMVTEDDFISIDPNHFVIRSVSLSLMRTGFDEEIRVDFFDSSSNTRYSAQLNPRDTFFRVDNFE
ncbi:hypothetical protein S1OALGB6SA_2411 [Olavius algarvensis spirochete endosymbiont]|uniref:hypothetical protein n=1 Tax=Olavius algarvensis spirochete endosymbiont TaxID=260710 RepID=UPI000F239E17|nr:hypothetical protein [Olavius algarvensis spirochete endosymbiont]VDB01307.1 hypothetical protein S1OALGB6SA_2411 [Olavius algarvensis spirochete endosymbiont]